MFYHVKKITIISILLKVANLKSFLLTKLASLLSLKQLITMTPSITPSSHHTLITPCLCSFWLLPYQALIFASSRAGKSMDLLRDDLFLFLVQ